MRTKSTLTTSHNACALSVDLGLVVDFYSGSGFCIGTLSRTGTPDNTPADLRVSREGDGYAVEALSLDGEAFIDLLAEVAS